MADDDEDDSNLFQEVLKELPFQSTFTIVTSGDRLMQMLTEGRVGFPDILFLDLNMPGKTGYDCLLEIRQNEKLKHIPIVIFSTSFEYKIMTTLYNNGANYYIRKPNDYSHLKKVIYLALTSYRSNKLIQPTRENFVLTHEIYQIG